MVYVVFLTKLASAHKKFHNVTRGHLGVPYCEIGHQIGRN